MGSLFRPTYKDSAGNRRESAVWWMKFYVGGKAVVGMRCGPKTFIAEADSFVAGHDALRENVI